VPGAERGPLLGAKYGRLADAAGSLRPLADGLVAVPALRAAPAVRHHPRRGADARPPGGGAREG
jgi:hypothetical protein